MKNFLRKWICHRKLSKAIRAIEIAVKHGPSLHARNQMREAALLLRSARNQNRDS